MFHDMISDATQDLNEGYNRACIIILNLPARRIRDSVSEVAIYAVHAQPLYVTDHLQVLVHLRHALSLADLLAAVDQQQQWQPRDKVDDGKHAPRDVETSALTERQCVETNGKGKDLTEQVDDGGHLGGLGLVTIRNVRVRQSRSGLNTDGRDSHADGQGNPGRLVGYRHTVDDETGGQEQTERGEVQTSLRLSVAIMTTSISVNQPIGNPARASLTDETANSQRHTEQQTVLRNVKVIQLLRDTRRRQDEDDGAVGVGGHVVDARQHDGHVPEHLEVGQKVGRLKLAVDDLAAEGQAAPVGAVLERAELGAGEERLGEGHEVDGEDAAHHDGVDLEDPAPALVLGDETTGNGTKVRLLESC